LIFFVAIVVSTLRQSALAFLPSFQSYEYSNRRLSTTISKSHSSSTVADSSTSWYPRVTTYYDDDIFADADEDDSSIIAQLEENIVEFTAALIQNRLSSVPRKQNNQPSNQTTTATSTVTMPLKQTMQKIVRGRFLDLTCTARGEEFLERIYYDQQDEILRSTWEIAQTTASMAGVTAEEVMRGSVLVVQSLCIMGMQVGVMGSPEQLRRNVAYLAKENTNNNKRIEQKHVNGDDKNNNSILLSREWDNERVRYLKFIQDRTPALQCLAKLRWKRTAQGAFDLLVALGAWEVHEDLALLRSGFPIRFTQSEQNAANNALIRSKLKSAQVEDDIDEILGLRQDLRHLKVYTIDGASTSEIDDGVSVEIMESEKGQSPRYRIWVHIADADRWAPRVSDLFEAARKRITSLYLPSGAISMFPPRAGTELMSLKANQDLCYALSLGVILRDDDGSIDLESLILTPSIIRVSYRLTYDVSEMMCSLSQLFIKRIGSIDLTLCILCVGRR
jgi:hypothetical protein